MVKLFLIASALLNFMLLAALAQPEIQAASDRICVPLYNETGYECCQ
jgi:hypothetical protein